ncbi:MAG: glycosyl hydrolase [Rikenellaceae bacterium]
MKKFYNSLIFLLSLLTMISITATSCNNSKEITPKKEILNRLSTVVAEGKFLFGHQDSYFYGHHWKRPNRTLYAGAAKWRSDIKDVCGDYPAVLGCDLGGIERGDTHDLDSVHFETMREAIIAQHEMGGVTAISWHSRNPVTGGDSWDCSRDTVMRALLPGHSYHETYMQWLTRAATFLKTLTDKDGMQIPVIFRPYHEHTGHWFWWGKPDSSPEDYIQLWRMTHDYLTKEGLSNLIWAYSPNLGVDSIGYMVNYPGDEYVDLLGYDAYQFGGSEGGDQYVSDLKRDLKMIARIGEKHNKLIALTETGLETLPDPRWWTNRLLEAVKELNVCYILVWRNAHDRPEHYYAPFLGQQSAPDFIEFYNSPKTIFLKDLQKIHN